MAYETLSASPKKIVAVDLGITEYREVWRLQQQLFRRRLAGDIPDILLLNEHRHVYTLGKNSDENHLLASEQHLCDRGIAVVPIDRGGDVTYHGPGQLIVYPILDLRQHGLGVPGYVWNLEEMTVRYLTRQGISAGRVEKMRGVWAGQEKIASLGVHLSRWISKHGLALNVNTDLDPFKLINPCGTGRQVTSMEKILGRSVPMTEVETGMLESFAELFTSQVNEEPAENLDEYA